MLYNVRIKTFPDGHKQYLWSSELIFRLDEDNDPPELVKAVKAKRKRQRLFREIYALDRGEDDDASPGYERRRNNMSHSINEVYDIARSNDFNWFITLTFDKNKVNRYDYDSCSKAIRLFTKRLERLGCKWLIVPEQHKDGAYHFHGLVAGELPLIPSGKTCYNEAAQQELPIYNLANYEFGFTTVTQVMKPDRTASYITKYLTKQIAVPKGKKCYWASRSLARPTVEYVDATDDVNFVFGAPAGIRYFKDIESMYGRFVISEE